MKQKAKPSFAELFALMRRRQSIRRFKGKPLSKKQILKIISAGVTAPSSLNSQPWKFVVLKSAAKKKRLREIYTNARVKLKLYEQDTSFVEKATPIIVVCEDSDYGKVLSCGMAIYPGDANESKMLFKQADRALYASKRGGKNRISNISNISSSGIVMH